MEILFVDDEPDLLELGRLYLRKEKNDLEIKTATSALEGLEMIQNGSGNVDAIVSDYDMPEMDGFEFCETLKENGSDVPFIVFTGSGKDGLDEEAQKVGVDSYLRKGGNPRERFSVLAETIMEKVKKHNNGE